MRRKRRFLCNAVHALHTGFGSYRQSRTTTTGAERQPGSPSSAPTTVASGVSSHDVKTRGKVGQAVVVDKIPYLDDFAPFGSFAVSGLHLSDADDWKSAVKAARAEAVCDVFRFHTTSGMEWIDVQGTLSRSKGAHHTMASTESETKSKTQEPVEVPKADSDIDGKLRGDSGTPRKRERERHQGSQAVQEKQHRLFRPATDLAFMACVAPLLSADGVHDRLVKEAVRRILLPQCRIVVGLDDDERRNTNGSKSASHGEKEKSSQQACAGAHSTTKACCFVCRFPSAWRIDASTDIERIVLSNAIGATAESDAGDDEGSTPVVKDPRHRSLASIMTLWEGLRQPSGEDAKKRREMSVRDRNKVPHRTAPDSIQHLTNRLTVFILPHEKRIVTCHRVPLPIISKMRSNWGHYRHSESPFQLLDEIVKACVDSFCTCAAQDALELDRFESALFPHDVLTGSRQEDREDTTAGVLSDIDAQKQWIKKGKPGAAHRGGLFARLRGITGLGANHRSLRRQSEVIERIYLINRRASVYCRLLQPLPYAYAQAVASTSSKANDVAVTKTISGSISAAPSLGKSTPHGGVSSAVSVAGLTPHAYSRDDHSLEVAYISKNALSVCEELRESSQSLLTLHFQLSSSELEDLVRIITLISTVFIPLGFITSIFGMNFLIMDPLYESTEGILLCVLLMSLTTFGTWFWVWVKLLARTRR